MTEELPPALEAPNGPLFFFFLGSKIFHSLLWVVSHLVCDEIPLRLENKNKQGNRTFLGKECFAPTLFGLYFLAVTILVTWEL